MKAYQVSILIPVYKASNFIEQCAESVFSQSFESIEYVFVDDASPDDSMDKLQRVLNKFPQRKEDVRIIRNEQNKGISVSRQRAFDAAAGTYFLAMDSDDRIEPDMVELLYGRAQDTKAQIVYCSYFEDFVDGKNRVMQARFKNDKKVLIENVLKGQSAYWNKLISRDLLTGNRIRTIAGVDMADDLIVLVKLIYYADVFAMVEKPLYHYVQYNPNAVTKSYTSKHVSDVLTVIDDVERFLNEKEDYAEYEAMLTMFKASRKIKIIRSTFADKQYLSLFPEINDRIGLLDLPLKSKIILFLAQKNHVFLSRLFLRMLKGMDRVFH